MRKVSIFKNGANRAIRIPKDMDPGVNELEISVEGNAIVLRPVRPDWLSFAELPRADNDFLQERDDVIVDDGRFQL